MTRGQRLALMALAVAVLLAGGAAVLLRDDQRAEVRADEATTSSTFEATTTGPSTTVGATTSVLPPTNTTAQPAAGDGTVSSTTGAAASSTTTAATPSTDEPPTRAAPGQADAPPFRSSIEPVTAEQLGSSWRAGCPLGPEQLRAVNVTHWGYDGEVHQGRVVVDAAHAERVATALRDVYEAGFLIERMETIDRYGGDDQASMRANNTSAFNCRYVSGTTRWSEHSYGRAIDINPLVNPYVKGSTVDPPEGAPYADRTRNDPGMIKAGDAVVQAFERQGWSWGGYWSTGPDYQHFSASGR